MRTLLFALVLFAIGPLALSNKLWSPNYHWEGPSIVIDDDGGGVLSTFIMWYKRVQLAHIHVVLRGQCVSACTLLLMLPKEQVCVEPTGSLGFHQVSTEDDDGKRIALPDETQALIRRYYPPAVQQWLNGKKLDLKHIEYMYADEIVSLGIFDACANVQ